MFVLSNLLREVSDTLLSAHVSGATEETTVAAKNRLSEIYSRAGEIVNNTELHLKDEERLSISHFQSFIKSIKNQLNERSFESPVVETALPKKEFADLPQATPVLDSTTTSQTITTVGGLPDETGNLVGQQTTTILTGQQELVTESNMNRPMTRDQLNPPPNTKPIINGRDPKTLVEEEFTPESHVVYGASETQTQ